MGQIADPTLPAHREDRDTRGRRAREQVVQTEPLQNITPPKFIKGGARRCWQRVAPKLVAAGLLTEFDKEAFAAYCLCYHRIRMCHEVLARDGYTVEIAIPEPGQPGIVPHPLLKVAYMETENLCRLMRKFGLSPSDRCKLKPSHSATVEQQVAQMEDSLSLDELITNAEARERELRGDYER